MTNKVIIHYPSFSKHRSLVKVRGIRGLDYFLWKLKSFSGHGDKR